MIKTIKFDKYRKLQGTFEFKNGINVIAGANGTSKSSLLHLISNSYQKVTRKFSWINDDTRCLSVINKLNDAMNLKIESLTRGDKEYNNPANDVIGDLFTVEYQDGTELGFRRHNTTSESQDRYAIKPTYTAGRGESLPAAPVVYLGLSRLVTFGEFNDDSKIQNLGTRFPDEYEEEVAELYEMLTTIKISNSTQQKMGDVKNRTDFDSATEGIDSNTISAGEDNLLIILNSLISLKYYYEYYSSELEEDQAPLHSILLIDELDATLHPSLQIRLVDLLASYNESYNIQVFFTTHSLTLLEKCLKSRHNVIYLIDNVNEAAQMVSPDIYKIKMHLEGLTRQEIYIDRAIPVFTEDEEARLFLKILFEHYSKEDDEFKEVSKNFHFVQANIGSDNLKNIFQDSILLNTTMRSICILDGDQENNLSNYIITLPGDKSPEELVMDYSFKTYDTDDDFWNDQSIQKLGYSKSHFDLYIRPDIDAIQEKIQEKKDRDESTRGLARELKKKVFIDHQTFFVMIFKNWVNKRENEQSINQFFKELNILFKKVAEFHEINSREWNSALQ